MPRPVDALIATIDQLRPVVMDLTFGDAYQIVRDVLTDDLSGGWTKTPQIVESDYCSLNIQRLRTRERVIGGVTTVGEASYQATMKPTTLLIDTDKIVINGRAFRVIALRRGGGLEMFPIADLQEWDEDAT